MDAAVLLDLLGNENRRRILRLLSHKPCYVTEISEYLGVSPKAVIDHLRRLEEAGLVESRTDDQRRKYFHIARNIRLEVSVSPYQFGAKSAYPASRGLDMRGRCQYISLNIPDEGEARTPDSEGDAAADDDTVDTDVGSEPENESDADDAEPSIDAEPDAAPPHLDADAAVANGGTDTSGVAGLAEQYAYLEDVESELSLAQRWVHGRVTDILDDLSEQLGSEADSRFYAELLATLARGPKTTREIAEARKERPDRVEQALQRLVEENLVEYDGTAWRIV